MLSPCDTVEYRESGAKHWRLGIFTGRVSLDDAGNVSHLWVRTLKSRHAIGYEVHRVRILKKAE